MKAVDIKHRVTRVTDVFKAKTVRILKKYVENRCEV